MAVTEIALLSIQSPSTSDDAGLHRKLTHAKNTMQEYTGRSFYYFQQVEDESKVYIIGEWDSLDQHINDFIPSPENQAVLQSLKDDLSIEWLQHIEASHADLSLPATEIRREQALAGDLVWSIVRHWIKPGHKGSFQDSIEKNAPKLQPFVSEGLLAGGWRVDSQDGSEEYVVLCPWRSVEQRSAFLNTEVAKQYGQMHEHLENVEAKHLRLLDI